LIFSSDAFNALPFMCGASVCNVEPVLGMTFGPYDVSNAVVDGTVVLLLKAPTPSSNDATRFIREVQALSLVQHPNILTPEALVYEQRRLVGVIYPVFRRTLDSALSEPSAMPLRNQRESITGVAEGLEYLGCRGLYPASVDPGHIFVDALDTCKIRCAGLLEEGQDVAGGQETHVIAAYGQLVCRMLELSRSLSKIDALHALASRCAQAMFGSLSAMVLEARQVSQ
jgi:hypothetical protein